MAEPSIGRIVHYRQPEHEQPVNGQRVHPAIVTTVFGPEMVNLTVFFDARAPEPRTSVAQGNVAQPADGAGVWDWPART